jgi:hypothetical protein
MIQETILCELQKGGFSLISTEEPGHHLVLVALNTRFGDNAGVSSFSQESVKAAPAADSVSGGKVRINVFQSFSGSLRVLARPEWR